MARAGAGEPCEAGAALMPAKKYDKKGRNRSFRFAQLEYSLLASAPYRALPPNPRALLVELIIMFNGQNNGELYLSVRDAADRMGVADTKAASAALKELQDMGFIAEVERGHFAVKAGNKRASRWRLTWHAVAGQHGPTNEYKDRMPEPGTRAHTRMEKGLRVWKDWSRSQNKMPVVESPTVFPETVVVSTTNTPPDGNKAGGSVADSTTAKHGNSHVSVNEQCGGIPYTYILSGSPVSGRRAKTSAPDPADDIFMGSDELRAWVQQAITGLPFAQSRLGEEANVPKGTLSKFLRGASLPRRHRISVQQALPRVVAAMRTNSAGNTAG